MNCALRESKNEMSHYMTKIVTDVTQFMISAGTAIGKPFILLGL